MPKKINGHKVNRSAVTGKFVTDEFAKKNKATTVTEKMKKKGNKKRPGKNN